MIVFIHLDEYIVVIHLEEVIVVISCEETVVVKMVVIKSRWVEGW